MKKRSTVYLFVVTVLLALSVTALQAQEEGEEEILDHLHILTNFLEGETTKIPLALTTETAEEEEGYVMLGECIPGMGIHAATMGEQGPEQPILMFNISGDLIGLEFESLTEQATPPWELLEEGHPGMEFEHWTLHIYFTHEPELACEEMEEE
jgi:hypothetical protein